MQPDRNPTFAKDGRDRLCHPFQPLAPDDCGALRFKENAIVRWLVDQTPGGMNTIAAHFEFSREDRVQLAQLIGYSHAGFSELGYVREEDVTGALNQDQFDRGRSDARVRALQAQLREARNGMSKGLAALFERHPDDFKETQ